MSPYPADRPCGAPGIDIHRAPSLAPADATEIDRIPCTTVPGTLLDLAEVVDRRALERSLGQADVLRLLDIAAIGEVLDRARGRRGAARLEALIGRDGSGGLTESELEERFLATCVTAALPTPEVNSWINIRGSELKADFVCRERLIVETDGYRFHGGRRAFERDRRRDQLLVAAGWRVIRITWRQLASEPKQLGAMLRAVLMAPPRRVPR